MSLVPQSQKIATANPKSNSFHPGSFGGQSKRRLFCGSNPSHGVIGLQPLADAPTILSRGRRSRAVNGRAHPDFDERRSEGPLSRSEVVCPRGVGASFGSRLPSCFPVRPNADFVVDRRACGEVRSETGRERLFFQHDDALDCFRRYRVPHGDRFGVSVAGCRPLEGSKTIKMTRPRVRPRNER